MTVQHNYDNRLQQLRAAMSDHNADVFICDHAEMLLWLTGYTISETRYRACLVPKAGAPVWVLRSIDEVPCRKSTWVNNIITVDDHEDPVKAVAGVISDLGCGAATVAADYCSYGFTASVSQQLRTALPDANWVDMPDVSNQIRAIKEPAEIALIRQAAAIADGAMKALTEQIEPGMRPRDVAALAAAYYLQHGADDWWVGPISISLKADANSSDTGFLHQGLVDDVLNRGDVLHVELVPRVSCYSGRIMRSISVGEADEKLKSVMNLMVELQDTQFETIKPGAVASSVDQVLRQAILREGIRPTYGNASGYQIGLYAKTPRSSDFSLSFHSKANWKLRTGMAFHMYVSAQGLAMSDSVLVTDSGYERLTMTDRELLASR